MAEFVVTLDNGAVETVEAADEQQAGWAARSKSTENSLAAIVSISEASEEDASASENTEAPKEADKE